MSRVLVLGAIHKAVEQHVQRADPGEVGVFDGVHCSRGSAGCAAAAISAKTPSEDAAPAAVSHQRRPLLGAASGQSAQRASVW